MDGPVLGVLTIDGRSEFGPLPWYELSELFLSQGVLEHVQRRTFEVGYVIAQAIRRIVESEKA